MIGKLLRILLKPRRRHVNLTQPWEYIGHETYGQTYMTRVPAWVKKQVKHIRKTGPGSSLGELTYYLKGKRYRYKLDSVVRAGLFCTSAESDGSRQAKGLRTWVVMGSM